MIWWRLAPSRKEPTTHPATITSATRKSPERVPPWQSMYLSSLLLEGRFIKRKASPFSSEFLLPKSMKNNAILPFKKEKCLLWNTEVPLVGGWPYVLAYRIFVLFCVAGALICERTEGHVKTPERTDPKTFRVQRSVITDWMCAWRYCDVPAWGK